MNMGILNRMLGRESEARALSATIPMSAANFPSIDTYSPGTRNVAGVVVSERTALSHSVVYASARLLVDALSSLPMHAYDELPDGTLKRSAVQPEIVTSPFVEVDRQPGLFSVIISMVLRGNSYLVVVDRDATGFPSKLMVVHPDWVRVSRDPTTGRIIREVNNVVIADEDIIHTPTFVMPGNPVGLSPIEAASGSVGLALAQNIYTERYFSDGAAMSGIIEVPGELDQEKATRIVKMFSSRHSGVRRSHAVGLLSGGAKFSTISLSPEQSQLLESRSYTATELAMLIGVQPEMLGLPGPQTFAGAGLEVRGRTFLQYSLRPYIARLENIWARLLPDGQVMRLSTDELIAPDRQTRYTAHHLALSDGWKNINEVRSEEGLAPIEGGDVYMRPLYLGEAGTENNPNNTTPTRPRETEETQ